MAIDVEQTVAVHNLLFLVRNLVAGNKFVETFDWLSCRKKCVFVGFCALSKPKKNDKKWPTKKLVEFHNHLHILTMI